MNDTVTLCQRLRANDPDYARIDMHELDRSNPQLLNLTAAALEHNTVVSEMILDISGFTAESATAMGTFLRASNNLKKVVLSRATVFPDVLYEQHTIIFCILLRALLCSKSVKDIQLEGFSISACDKAFADLLPCSKFLEKLAIFWTPGTEELHNPDAATTIADALASSGTVKDLSLSEWPESSLVPFLTGLHDHSVLNLLALQNVQSLTGLDLLLQDKHCKIAELLILRDSTGPTTWDNRSLPSLEPLVRGINRNKTVTHLTVGEYSLAFDQAAQLKGLLCQNTLIDFLDIAGASLGSAGMAEIAAGIYRNTTLKHLNMSDNALGDLDSAKTLRDLLRRNKSLTILWIQKNPFGRTLSCVRCIAEGLRGNRTLETINLSHCSLGDRGISVLANVLGSSNKTLKGLLLSDNQITSTGLGVLLDLVAETLPIVKLDLTGNPLGTDGANLLANALERNALPSLQELWIERCGVGNEGLQEIASALELNTSLALLSLEGNVFSKPGLLALAGSLPNIKALDYIGLTWNASFASCMPVLVEGLRANKSLRDVFIHGRGKGEWTQEFDLLVYRNRFHHLLTPPPDIPLDTERNISTLSHALARVATRPDVLFHVLCSKPQLVRPAGGSKKRKRDDVEGDKYVVRRRATSTVLGSVVDAGNNDSFACTRKDDCSKCSLV